MAGGRGGASAPGALRGTREPPGQPVQRIQTRQLLLSGPETSLVRRSPKCSPQHRRDADGHRQFQYNHFIQQAYPEQSENRFNFQTATEPDSPAKRRPRAPLAAGASEESGLRSLSPMIEAEDLLLHHRQFALRTRHARHANLLDIRWPPSAGSSSPRSCFRFAGRWCVQAGSGCMRCARGRRAGLRRPSATPCCASYRSCNSSRAAPALCCTAASAFTPPAA